jgi:dephospho-CoA kinase
LPPEDLPIPNLPRVIGLTGGIATGKSTVTKYLADRYQLPILDADLYAREAVAVGGEILAAIVDRYGPDLLLANNELNRGRLGEIIFAQVAERQWVESLIHPYVRQCHQRDLLAAKTSQVVASIPLLFEANLQAGVDEIWVVVCSAEQQLTRLMQRNPQLSLAAARQRIASQMPLADKIRQADRVLDNSGAVASLYAAIDRALISSQV